MNLSGLLPLIHSMPAYQSLLAHIDKGRARTMVLDAAKPYLVACLYHDFHCPILLITPRPEKARQLYNELTIWCSDKPAIQLFPEPDALPYERLTPDPTTIQQRLKTFSILSNAESTPLVIASAHAVMPKTIPPTAFACHIVRKGTKFAWEQMLSRWRDMGYELKDAVELPGTMSHRGGIIDIYPPDSEFPARIELYGYDVESIRLFNPSTQCSLRQVSEVRIIPAVEMVLPAKMEREKALCQLNLSSLNAEVRDRFKEEMGLLLSGEWFNGCEFYAPLFNRASTLDYLPSNSMVILDEPKLFEAKVASFEAQATELRGGGMKGGNLPSNFPIPYFTRSELMDSLKGFHRFLSLEEWGEENEHHLGFSPAPNYSGRLTTFTQESTAMAKEGYRVIVVSQQASRLSELLQEQDTVAFPISDIGQMPQPGSITLLQGSVYGGWAINQEAEPLILFSDAELFGFVKKRRVPQKRPVPRGIFLTELVPGEYVVHIDHGVARFSGMAKMSLEGKEGEYLVLEYAEGDKLYVPSEQVDRVSRYIGPRGYTPALSRLGTAEWGRTKQRVRKATANLAQELLSIYASREHSPGFAFSPDTPWQQELEASFPYIETTDQLEAVQEVKGDMERARPMERLLCGDVGYGKTEVALRAAFKAVLDGMQVALLVPTTVLAQQHFTTFNERLNPFPIRVEMLSRFRPPKGQAEITEGLKCGTVDICIGTHRLLQKDVEFRNLGLVIIDEEQRFGVAHKERLKKLRQEVDVLTLSATPIPRTLHMSLVGIRDLSIMETPPEERLPIKSYVAEYDEGLIREAILRELERGGQVFFVHNRVQTISSMAMKLRNSVPEASFAVAHGQMPEEELESVMLDFVMGKGDVLVCTTIIESGLDLPNVNTIIINDADKLGLTQLYQLRGRVGRGSNRAYAYFLYKRGKRLTDAATKRLRTIFEATELGSGFYIAMKDLEIRGAGNILGAEQSGHMGAVGFELYSQLLAEAVAELKPEERKPPPPPITIDLPLPAFLPEEYIPHLSTRLALYQRLAKTSSAQDAEDIGQELRDRFGEIPQPALNLLYVVKIKALAAQAGIQDISTEGNYVVLKLAPGAKIDKGLMHNLGEGLKIGTTQLRLDMKRHKNWQRILEEVLVRMLLPEEVGSKNLSVQL